MNMKTKIFLLIGVLFLVSCSEDFITRDLDKSRDTPNTYFNSVERAEQAVNAVYSGLRAAYTGNPFIMSIALGDELYGTINATGWSPWGNTINFDIQNTHNNVAGIWNNFYSYILRANFALDQISVVKELRGADFSQDHVDLLTGQTLFMRGFSYYMLSEFYPKDKIVLREQTTSGGDDIHFTPSSASETFAFIEADLKKAQELLAKGINTTSGYDKWRITRGAATAILGRLYLSNKDYVKAAAEFKKLLPGVGDAAYGTYALGDYKANFTEAGEHNSESIFELEYTDIASPNQRNSNQVQNWTHNRVLFGGSMWFNFAVPTYNLDEFETWTEGSNTVYDYRAYASLWGVPEGAILTYYGDEKDWKEQGWRLDVYEGEENVEVVGGTNKNGVTSIGSYGIRKRSLENTADLINNSVNNSAVNVRLIRLSDIMLLYAECLANINSGNTSISDPESGAYWVQQVRDRANKPMNDQEHLYSARTSVNGQLPSVTALMTAKSWTLMDVIEHERYVELYAEGWRFVDLKRWEKGANYRGINKAGWNGWQSLTLPIPKTEIDNNPNFE